MRKNYENSFEQRDNYDFKKKTFEISEDDINVDDYQDLAYKQTYDKKFYKQQNGYQSNYNNDIYQHQNLAMQNGLQDNQNDDFSNFDYEDDDDIDFQSESQQDDFESIDINVNKFKNQEIIQQTKQSQLNPQDNFVSNQTSQQKENSNQQNSFKIDSSIKDSKQTQNQLSIIQDTQVSQQVQELSRPEEFQQAESFKDDLSDEVHQFYESQKLSKFQQSNKDTFKSDFEDVEFSQSKKSPKNIQNNTTKKDQYISAFSFQKQDNLKSQNIKQQNQKNLDEQYKNFEEQIDQQVQVKLNSIQKEKELLFNENLKLKNEKFELQQQLKKINKNVDTAFDQLSKTDLKKEGFLMQMQKLNEELQDKDQILQQREKLIQKLQKDKICPQDILENRDQEIQILNEQIKFLKDENKILEEQLLLKSNNIKFDELNTKIKNLEDQLMQKENLIYQQKLQNKIDNISDKNLQEVITQEQIINGYIKENKRLIEENRFYRQNYYKEKIKQEQKFLNPQDPQALQKEHNIQVNKMNQQIEILQKQNEDKQIQINHMTIQLEDQQNKLQQQIKNTPKKQQKKKTNPIKSNMEQRQFYNEYKKDKEEMKQLIEQLSIQIKKKNKKSKNNQVKIEPFSELKDLINQLNQENTSVKKELEDLKKMNETNHQFVRTEFNNYFKQQSISEQKEDNKQQEIIQEQQIDQIIEEKQFLEAKTNKLSLQLQKVREENEKLLEIIKKMPKQAKNIDFAILEQKVINMEKEYKLKKLQYDNAIKIHSKIDNSTEQKNLLKEQQKLQQVIYSLKETIKIKDSKLIKFKQSFDNLLLEFKRLKTNSCNQQLNKIYKNN